AMAFGATLLGRALVGKAAAREEQQVTRAAAQLRAGEAPLWDPIAGEPLLEGGSIGTVSPLILPNVVLSPTWAWTVRGFVALLIAGIGAWMLTGIHGLSAKARVLAAATFMLLLSIIASRSVGWATALPCLPWCV